MKEHFWNKRIPTLLGIFLIGIGLIVTTFLVRQGGFISINASPTTQPQNVRISNITNDSFTVSYETTDSVFGVLSYGNSIDLGKSGLDDRDQETGNISAHKLHNITVRNLNPETKYYFSIISGKDTFLNNNNPYEVTTGIEISDTPSDQEPVSGKILLPDGKTPTESVVYLTTEGSQVISTLVKNDGTFLIPLNSLRTTDLSSYSALNPNQLLKLLAMGEGLTSSVIISLDQVQPIPTISLSSNYDFTTNEETTATNSAVLEVFPSFSSTEKIVEANSGPKILNPERNESLSDQKPNFTGTANPNETIQVIIHSDEKIQVDVKTDSKGNWSYRPSKDLSPGNHTITVVAKDKNGILRTIVQSFVVYASGSQIAGESGSPTPTTKPQATVTQPPTSTPTTVPNTTVTTTVTIPPDNGNNVVTITEAATKSPTPTTPLPPTGNPTIISFGIVGLVVTLLGSLLFLLSRKSII